MNYKIIIAGAIIGLGLTTQVDAQVQHTKKGKTNVRALATKLSNQMLGMQYEGLVLQKGESPLSIERRIVKQEILEDGTVTTQVNYGYAGNNYGMQFHNSFFLGFPSTINASGVNEIFMNPNSIAMSEFASTLFYPNTSGTNILADTIKIISEGTEVAQNYVSRSSNLAVNSWLYGADEGSGTEYSKQENIYNTSGKIVKINTFYGMDINNLTLESVRKITYNSTNDKVIADTIENMNGGVLSYTETFDYTYDNTGKLIKVKYVDSDFPDDSSLFNFSYYSNGNLQMMKAKEFEGGVEAPFSYTDSLTYQTGTNIASRSVIMDMMGNIQGYRLNFYYNNNRLDTVKQYMLEPGLEELVMFAKYQYSTDNNPDSLVAYDGADPTLVIGKMNFYYENYNTTSVNNLVRNNNFEVFPVPVNGNSFNLNSKVALKNKNATITVMNINGAKIFSTTRTLNDGVNTINIPTNLAAGNYIVEVIADNSVFTQKISKL
jgi:hypothetical protein